MRGWLNSAAQDGRVDIMHNHSLWMMPNVYSCRAVKGTGHSVAGFSQRYIV